MRAALYARVSTADGQHVETQLRILREYAARARWTVQEFTETASGAATKRPELEHLMRLVRARAFDYVVVTRIDRLARSLSHFLEIVRELEHYQIPLVVTEQGIDLSAPSGRLQAQILGAMAEFERELIRARTREGLHRARLEGKQIGRPKVERPAGFGQAALELRGNMEALAKRFGVAASTARKWCLELGLDPKDLRAAPVSRA